MKKRILACLFPFLLLLSACSLIPEEEVLPQMPLIKEIPAAEPETIAVMRGDMLEEKTFSCSYQPTNQEKLYFPQNNQLIAAVYVQPGDTVKAGDLLAELDNTQLQQKIDSQQATVDSLNLQITQEQNYIRVQKERIQTLKTLAQENPSYDTRITSAEASLESRNSQLNYLYSKLSVENLALEELHQQLKQRQLYAPMDGTISYTVTLSSTPTYTKNTLICTIQDLSHASFTGSFKSGLLKLEEEVVLRTDTNELQAVVSQISAPDSSGNCTVTFTLLTPDPTLTSGQSARTTLTTRYLQDVLYLPNAAIQKKKEVSFVYYTDESGQLAAKSVVTGDSINGHTHIISGLEEGDIVLADIP